MNPQENGDETYSIIYSALKHPVRRRILRTLSEKPSTYTELLRLLDLETGHLNFYLEGLGELILKTEDGKYRLSDYGKAAVDLMAGVEETERSRPPHGKKWVSHRRLLLAVQAIAVIALVVAAAFFLNVKYTSEYTYGGALMERVLAPNQTLPLNDYVNKNDFPINSSTSTYYVFFRIFVSTNASLRVQLIGGNNDGAIHPNIDDLPIGAYVLYDQQYVESAPQQPNATRGFFVDVPISPSEDGYSRGEPESAYEVRINNLGWTNSGVTCPDNAAFVSLKTGSPFIRQVDTPYFYLAVALLVVAALVGVLPLLARALGKI